MWGAYRKVHHLVLCMTTVWVLDSVRSGVVGGVDRRTYGLSHESAGDLT